MKSCSLDEWRDFWRPLFDIRIKTRPEAFVGQIGFRSVDRLIRTRVRFSPQLFHRDPSAIKGFDHEYLLFERYESGSGRGTV